MARASDVKLQKELLKLKEDSVISDKELEKISVAIYNNNIKSVTALKEAFALGEKNAVAAEKEAAATQQRVDAIGEVYDVSNRILSTQIKLAKGEENAFNVTVDQAAAKMDQLKADKKRIKALSQSKSITAEEQVLLEISLEKLENQEGAYAAIMRAHTAGGDAMKRNQLAFDSLNSKADDLGKNIDEAMSSFPGGGFLSKALGLDNASAKIKKGIQEGFKKANEEIANGKKGMFGLRAGAAAFNAVLAINPLLLVVAAAKGLFDILDAAEKKGRALAENTGMDLLRSQKLVDATKARSTKSDELLASTQDLLDVQTEVISTMGPFAQLSQEVASNIGETAAAFGYSAKTAGQAQASLMSMGVTADEAAKAQEELAADAFKAGVNVGAVMEDIAKNSKKASQYMGGNVKEIKKAAIEAAKLGLNLGDLTSIADGLLNIEDSLSNQFQFQAMTGKQINLDKARELALAGDLAGMAKEISKEAGDINEFNKMNVLERKALAKSMGMEVDQLQNMLALDKVREKVGDDLAKQAAELGINADELRKMGPAEIKRKIAETRESERMRKSMADMIESFKKSLLPAAEAFMGIIAAVLHVIKPIGNIVKIIAGFFKSIYDSLGPLKPVVQIIGTLLLAQIVYTKILAKLANRRAKKQIEAMEHQKKMNELKQWEAQNAAKVTAEEKKQTKEAKAQADATERQNKAAKKQSQPKSRLGKLGSKIAGSRIGKAMGLGKGGIFGDMASLGGKVKDHVMGGGFMNPGRMMGMVPGFATGGEVGSTGIAKVHEGEMITPASKVPGSEPKGNGGAGIDYDKMTQAFMAAMKQMPAPQVNMDGRVVSDSVSANQSYDKGMI